MGLSIPNPINVVKDTANFLKNTGENAVKSTVSNTVKTFNKVESVGENLAVKTAGATLKGLDNAKDFAVHSAIGAYKFEEGAKRFALNKSLDAAKGGITLAKGAGNLAKAGFNSITHPGFANPPAAQGLKFSESKDASEIAYARNNAKVGDVYKFADGKEWKVADVQAKNNGFRAVALRPVDSNDKRVIVAFSGSDQAKDWDDNIAQGAGLTPPQYKDAVNFANKWKGIAGDNVTLTGHSLGGGLASYASVKTGLKATAINGAPLAANHLGLDPRIIGRVTQYYVPGEVLSVENAANPTDFRPGVSIPVQGRYSILDPRSIGRNHSLDSVAPQIGMPTFVRHEN